MTRIETGARLHAGLLDLAGTTSRAYGGAGFMIAGPKTIVIAARSSRWSVSSVRPLDSSTEGDLHHLVRRLSGITKRRAQIQVLDAPPQHIGLGSKTSLILSIISAANEELNLGLGKERLQLLSGRGGTSGIGIHGFFLGGFLVDRGHPAQTVASYVPSRFGRPANPPALSYARPIPTRWRFHLLVPARYKTSTGESERVFFQEATPLPPPEVHEAIALVYHDLVSAVESDSLPVLTATLRRLHQVAFKKRELQHQTTSVQQLYQGLSTRSDWAVGMSSMGPLLYVVTDTTVRRIDIRQAIVRTGGHYLGTFHGLGKRNDLA